MQVFCVGLLAWLDQLDLSVVTVSPLMQSPFDELGTLILPNRLGYFQKLYRLIQYVSIKIPRYDMIKYNIHGFLGGSH